MEEVIKALEERAKRYEAASKNPSYNEWYQGVNKTKQREVETILANLKHLGGRNHQLALDGLSNPGI
ncbi:hypothetical protein HWB91_gp23 [Bacillus phage vB_BboS-125]|uniref:Uncharacterized protein n=1 Tax=Bacillus phage vB_BboS-125 TaxID=2419618 RepID=A0A3G3BVW1_9CAUD|nr:hypothetical protein HWB91_gp23 [Bacillus phage vB_BboS-125]AYP68393.1 hypothetical protein BboS125_00023 [Bacillus phage vB_BboS-125]